MSAAKETATGFADFSELELNRVELRKTVHMGELDGKGVHFETFTKVVADLGPGIDAETLGMTLAREVSSLSGSERFPFERLMFFARGRLTLVLGGALALTA